MKRILSLFIGIMVLCSVILTGCSGGANKSSSTNSSTSGTVQDDSKRTYITVAIKADVTEENVIKLFKQGFEAKYPTYGIKYVKKITADYNKSIFDYSVTEFPDIIWAAGDNHAPVSAAGKFENLTPYFQKDSELKLDEKGLPVGYNTASFTATHFSSTDKNIWFMPRDFNQLVTFYNKALFDRAMKIDSTIKTPNDPSYYQNGKNGWNYQDYLDTCSKLRVIMDANKLKTTDDFNDSKLGISPDSFPSDAIVGWNVIAYTFVRGFGADVFDKSGNLTINTKEFKDASNALKSLVDKKFASKPSDGTNLFNRKKAAITFGVRPAVATAAASNIDVDFAPFPVLPVKHVVGSGCSGYAMSASSKNKEIAWSFLKYIISEEAQQKFGAMGAGCPVLNSLQENGDWKNFLSPSLNHKAFISNPDKAISVNFADMIKPEKQKNVTDEFVNYFYSLYLSNYGGKGSLDALITEYTAKLNTAKS